MQLGNSELWEDGAKNVTSRRTQHHQDSSERIRPTGAIKVRIVSTTNCLREVSVLERIKILARPLMSKEPVSEKNRPMKPITIDKIIIHANPIAEEESK